MDNSNFNWDNKSTTRHPLISLFLQTQTKQCGNLSKLLYINVLHISSTHCALQSENTSDYNTAKALIDNMSALTAPHKMLEQPGGECGSVLVNIICSVPVRSNCFSSSASPLTSFCS